MLAIFSDKNSVKIAPSTIVFTIVVLLSMYALYYLRSVILLVFLAFIIMIAINPLVRRLERVTKLSKLSNVALSYLIVILGIMLLVGLVVPPLVTEVLSLLRALDFPIFTDYFRNVSLSVQEINSLISRVGDSFSLLLLLVNTAFNGVFTVLMVLVLSFYLKLEREDLPNKLYWFTRNKKHIALAKKIIDEIEHQMGGWVRAQLLLMLAVGTVTYVGLLIIGVEYALPLAVIAAIFEMVPNIGPIIAAVPAIIIAFLSGGWVLAGIVGLLYLIIQQLENSVLVPRVMKASINVNSFITLVVILVGYQLAGVAGALLSLPTYIITRVIYSHMLAPKV